MESAYLIASIAGANELITRLRARDYWVALTIVVAGVIGALFGFYHVQGLADTLTGLLAGLAAAGSVTLVSHIGNKTVAQPSSIVK